MPIGANEAGWMQGWGLYQIKSKNKNKINPRYLSHYFLTPKHKAFTDKHKVLHMNDNGILKSRHFVENRDRLARTVHTRPYSINYCSFG